MEKIEFTNKFTVTASLTTPSNHQLPNQTLSLYNELVATRIMIIRKKDDEKPWIGWLPVGARRF